MSVARLVPGIVALSQEALKLSESGVVVRYLGVLIRRLGGKTRLLVGQSDGGSPSLVRVVAPLKLHLDVRTADHSPESTAVIVGLYEKLILAAESGGLSAP